MKNHGGLSVHEGTERREMKLKPFMAWIDNMWVLFSSQ